MKKLLLALFLTTGLTGIGQENEVLMKIDGQPIYKSEFEYIFQKNNKDNSVSNEDLDEYIDLFTKFKLKVTEAKSLGLDTMPKLIGELNGYRTQLSRQYLIDNELTDQLIEEAYNRMKKEVNASHILIKIQNGGDTLDAYNKAMDLYEKASKGETFSKLARENSEGPSGKNGGNLGWFSGFRMIYKFETAAFNTEIGKISKPVRTRFGYHVIKVNDIRSTRPDLKISHILIHVKPEASAEDKEKAEKKINEIYSLLKSNEADTDFASLVGLYSDDKVTAKKAGNLGWVSKQSFYDEIIEAAYLINEDGAYSKPVKSTLGWHIVKRETKKELGSLADVTPLIKSKLNRDERGSKSRTSKVNQLKVDYNFKLNLSAKKEISKVIQTKNYGENFSPETAAKYTKELFSFADRSITQEEFLLNFFELNRAKPKQDLSIYITRQIENFSNRRVINYEKENLEKKYPEFKSLMQEYTDGVLLFELTDQKVWSKAIKDTTGLETFYDTQKTNFMWDERVDYDLFSSTSKKHAKTAYKLMKKGFHIDSITNQINNSSELNINHEGGISEIKNVEFLDGENWEVKLYKVIEKSGKFHVLKIKEKLAKQPKKLEEAKGLVTSKYQDYLEEEWVKELKSKYKVEVNKDVLYSIVK